tara:strand:- start:203 stop:976 length:774 start_codon:yes stop_codon:yes gene_type:complete
MATGIINPHALAAAPNTAYRDAVLADNPLSLWMMDEPYGNNVATDQGTSPSDGSYVGALATSSTQRGSRTIFGLDAIGNATTGIKGGYVNCPMNTTMRNALSKTYSNFNLTFEFLINVDQLTSFNNLIFDNWLPWYFKTLTGGRLDTRWYSAPGAIVYVFWPTSQMSTGTDYHVVIRVTSGITTVRFDYYLNGVAKNNQTFNGFPGMGGAYPVGSAFKAGGVSTGANDVGVYGGLAGVAFYDYSLSGAQIIAHYNAL